MLTNIARRRAVHKRARGLIDSLKEELEYQRCGGDGEIMRMAATQPISSGVQVMIPPFSCHMLAKLAYVPFK